MRTASLFAPAHRPIILLRRLAIRLRNDPFIAKLTWVYGQGQSTISLARICIQSRKVCRLWFSVLPRRIFLVTNRLSPLSPLSLKHIHGPPKVLQIQPKWSDWYRTWFIHSSICSATVDILAGANLSPIRHTCPSLTTVALSTCVETVDHIIQGGVAHEMRVFRRNL